MTKILMLASSQELVARVNVLPGTQVVALDAATVTPERFDLMRSLDPQSLPDLMVLGEHLPVDRALAIARDSDLRYPMIDVVVVGEPEPGLLVELMRAGVRDVLEQGVDEERLLAIVRRADVHRAAAPAPGVPGGPVAPPSDPEFSRVVTVISPKGGVGKTSISTNLAIAMAQSAPQDVVLVDLDLQFGDVAATLDLVPTRTMEDALAPEAASDTLALKTMLTVHPAGLFVLCGAESPAANEDVTAEQVRRLLAQLSSQFSWVVVDTAAGLDEPTLAALDVTDDVVVVSTMDVACVRSVRREVDLLSDLGLLPPARTLALNLADRQSGMKVKDVEAVIGLPVDIVIPRSSDVQLAANHGRPIMLRKKRGGPFVKAIKSLSDRLLSHAPQAGHKHKRLEVA